VLILVLTGMNRGESKLLLWITSINSKTIV
jgi:hypothetical protein